MAVDDVSPAEVHSCSDVCVATQRRWAVGVVKRHYNVNSREMCGGVQI